MIHLFHDWTQWVDKQTLRYYEDDRDTRPYKTRELWFRQCNVCGKPQYKKVKRS